jgi:GR25 family glycosyltransferase involved in LPS biosynthesis
MTNNIYDFFEDIVCITLDKSQDRQQHASYYFNKLGIPARFHVATKHKKGGIYGCFESHINVIKDAYRKGLNNLLVFEDDFLPTAAYSPDKMQRLITFMQNNNDWDIVYLGYNCIKCDIGYFSSILDATYCNADIVKYNPYCAHALCYSRKCMKTILEEYEEYIGIVHYDMFLSSFLELNNYCAVPMLFDQNFYFEYNNEAQDPGEYILRLLFPVICFTKINYLISVVKYRLTHHAVIFFMFIMFLTKTKFMYPLRIL